MPASSWKRILKPMIILALATNMAEGTRKTALRPVIVKSIYTGILTGYTLSVIIPKTSEIASTSRNY
jgi:hypothetical protein